MPVLTTKMLFIYRVFEIETNNVYLCNFNFYSFFFLNYWIFLDTKEIDSPEYHENKPSIDIRE